MMGKNPVVAYDCLIDEADGQHVDDLRTQIGKDNASVQLMRILGRRASVGIPVTQTLSAAGVST
jgi:hypothetical protein